MIQNFENLDQAIRLAREFDEGLSSLISVSFKNASDLDMSALDRYAIVTASLSKHYIGISKMVGEECGIGNEWKHEAIKLFTECVEEEP